MKKIDKAILIIRNMTDNELRKFARSRCPHLVGLEPHPKCCGYFVADCEDCWNEEVEG